MAESPKRLNPKAEIHCEGQLVEKICRYFYSNDRFILGGVTCKFSKEEDVRQKLIQLRPSKEEEDQEDFVRILIILMCSMFLLPNKGYACPNNVARYLENLDATWEFSWASAVHEMIINDLRLFAQRVDPDLNINRDEEHLFRPHDATLIVQQIRMRAIKQLTEEERIKEKGKRKVLEGAKQKEGNKKKKTEEEVERGEGGEDSKRSLELLNKNKLL
ncbi:hypothetical protein QJS10_CPA03g01321 [Acorus calamus]|uniref:Aminotransferase-like plant mobile domain-containing protein n=1 Tax=Acorus calamus TaxID=4465 RepID=A0AAV9F8G3_ACOCL|nr:hypothetical protein QJS10_CPA03g01321 [Acorus calamus]